jgi:probable phosphoglycerate mutase
VDLPLLDEGVRMGHLLSAPLGTWRFSAVFSSPLRRAMETCALAGLGEGARVLEDLTEWDYGPYEGRSVADIRQEHPGWLLWRDGVPGGETAEQVGARADRVIAQALEVGGTVALFSHCRMLRVVGARWLGLPPVAGRYFAVSTASISVLGWDPRGEERLVSSWNDTAHLRPRLAPAPAP